MFGTPLGELYTALSQTSSEGDRKARKEEEKRKKAAKESKGWKNIPENKFRITVLDENRCDTH